MKCHHLINPFTSEDDQSAPGFLVFMLTDLFLKFYISERTPKDLQEFIFLHI